MYNIKKQFAVIGLSSALVLSQFSGLLPSSSFSEVAHAEENGTAGEILANLTQEQHDALTKLRSLNETGLHLTPEVNVEVQTKFLLLLNLNKNHIK